MARAVRFGAVLRVERGHLTRQQLADAAGSIATIVRLENGQLQTSRTYRPWPGKSCLPGSCAVAVLAVTVRLDELVPGVRWAAFRMRIGS
jgi:hypothetical protein